jgi:hypothetical protein
MTEAEFVTWAVQASDIRAEWVDGEVVISFSNINRSASANTGSSTRW